MRSCATTQTHNPDPLWEGHPWRMEVMDEAGGTVATLYFSIHPPKMEG
ncbi:hypothetical protein [Roseomonas sp. KE2513]|nr:hypothetical protein [Roseomonas sp. KE2513]